MCSATVGIKKGTRLHKKGTRLHKKGIRLHKKGIRLHNVVQDHCYVG